MRIEEGFQPVPYAEGNPYTTDPVLPSLLKRLLPSQALTEVEKDLERFGNEVLTTLRDLCKLAEPPALSKGWRALKDVFQREGIIGIFYERAYREHSRAYGFAKILLAVGDSEVIDCPLSMTDGVARVIEIMGTPALKRDIYPRLTSRDPAVAFTAGQWMTERPGGSDVSRTETVATAVQESASPYGQRHTLNGFKWFSSATDSDVALALARTGQPSDGSRGLSLFLIPLRIPLIRAPSEPRPSATTNNIFIHRLKNKVGTKTLPTAELSIEGADAYLVGTPNEGVKLITPVLNITRIHSAVASTGSLRKCLAIATAHSRGRAIRGGTQLLSDTPLHVAELARLHVLYRALVHFVFGAVVLLGKSECGVASEEELLRLRLLTPAVKAFAADKACTAMEECMTTLGGEGYMEENGFGKCIQDAFAEKIWEGTITVLALDLVRANGKSAALNAFIAWANTVLSSCPASLGDFLSGPLGSLRSALDVLADAYAAPIPPLVPRPALFLFCHIASGLYLLEHAIWAHSTAEPTRETDVEVLRRWVTEGGLDVALENVRRAKAAAGSRIQMDANIVYGRGSGTQGARL
ncbi:putative acyl-CoA dehydrogenase AidB [Grifola frondosa]|uniref:Putative acyl-CoA dehydrogenase AidB n=1 Tax=Grifola frondosa TaxID=5627 RepID=A0A1C7M323_GRIFR|nr:putative acyl-CoA dehydrogenase AidB [Grifola frondosa]